MKTNPHFLPSVYEKLCPEPQQLSKWVNTKTNPTCFQGAARDAGAQGKGWQSLQSLTGLGALGTAGKEAAKVTNDSEAELHFVHCLLLLLFTL